MTEQELRQKLARLESINDQLVSEIAYIDELMKLVGFSNGITTIKATAQDIFDGNVGEDQL